MNLNAYAKFQKVTENYWISKRSDGRYGIEGPHGVVGTPIIGMEAAAEAAHRLEADLAAKPAPAPKPAAPARPAKRTPRFPACDHYETDSRGICYDCGSYDRSSDAGLHI